MTNERRMFCVSYLGYEVKRCLIMKSHKIIHELSVLKSCDSRLSIQVSSLV